MKVVFWPKTRLGKVSVILSSMCIVLFFLATSTRIIVPSFLIVGPGLAGFITGVMAIVKRDRAVASVLPIGVGGIIVFVSAAIFIGTLGIFKDFPLRKVLSASEMGEMAHDTVNFGKIAEHEGHVYYVYKGRLYRRNADWSGQIRITDNPVEEFCLVGDWIYFMADANERLLSRMRLDGSGSMRICEDPMGTFIVDGEWIYYNSMGTVEAKTGGGGLYKIRNDGTGKVKMLDLGWEYGNPQFVTDGWIYFDDSNGVNRIGTDGTGRALIAEGTRAVEYHSGGWMYCCSSVEAGYGLEDIRIYRMKPDGTEKTVTIELRGVYTHCFDADWLYFTSGKGLSRLRLDGTDQSRLNEVNIWSLEGVAGDWFYISDYEGPVFRVRLDGSVGTRLN